MSISIDVWICTELLLLLLLFLLLLLQLMLLKLLLWLLLLLRWPLLRCCYCYYCRCCSVTAAVIAATTVTSAFAAATAVANLPPTISTCWQFIVACRNTVCVTHRSAAGSWSAPQCFQHWPGRTPTVWPVGTGPATWRCGWPETQRRPEGLLTPEQAIEPHQQPAAAGSIL